MVCVWRFVRPKTATNIKPGTWLTLWNRTVTGTFAVWFTSVRERLQSSHSQSICNKGFVSEHKAKFAFKIL